MDLNVENKIDQEYDLLSQNFKPEFGNQKHIAIIEAMTKLNQLEKTVKQKVADAKDATKLQEEYRRNKRNLVFMFKNL